MRLPLLCLGCLLAFSGQAQTYRPLKVHVYGGYGLPGNRDQSNGFVGGMEPRYSVRSHFEVGLRLEAAYLTRSFPTLDGLPGIQKRGTTSYLATANYYFGKTTAISSKSRLRPYVGVGLGNYRVYSASVTTALDDYRGTIQPVSRLGGMARLGVKVNHINLSAEYNLTGNTTAVNSLGKGNTSLDNTYWCLKVGLDVGGGRK